MANHATTVAPTSSSSLPPTIQSSATADYGDRNRPPPRLVFQHGSEMEQVRMQTPTRLPPAVPARPGPGPGAAVRISTSAPTVTTTNRPTISPVPLLPPINALLAAPPSTGSRNASPVSAESEVISLSQPRPDGERARNEYIETPLKGGLSSGSSRQVDWLSSTPLHAETHIHFRGSQNDHLALVPIGGVTSKSLQFNSTATSPSLKRLQKPRRSLPLSNHSVSAYTKDSSPAFGTIHHGQGRPSGESTAVAALVSPSGGEACGQANSREDSIICPSCSRCRCQSCRTPRGLPSKWLCRDKCLCSAESFVDYASCLCCVKGLFYHCGSSSDDEEYDDEEDHSEEGRHRHHPHQQGGGSGSCADAPCSCAPSHHRLARWGCLASLSLVLPCLLCYWPLQGGVKVVEMCYQRCTQSGCRCDQRPRPSSTAVVHNRSNAGQQQQVSHNSSSSKADVIASQPLPSSGKRLLDI